MYYPLNKILPNLYTSGREFLIKSTSQEYKGWYFSAYDGKYFTEKTPMKTSVELVKYEQPKPSSTLASMKYGKDAPDTNSTSHYNPTPSEDDYTRGYLTRYLIRRVNGDESTIREIDKQAYQDIQRDPLYISTSLLWKLTGKIEDTITAGGFIVPGVAKSNSQAIQVASRLVPGISSYLIDILQFHK